MKNYLKLFFLITLLACENGHAQTNDYLNQIGKKISVGSSNLTLGWLEIPKNVMVTSKEHNVLMGISVGVFKGLFHMMGRTLTGAFDVVTFPIPSESIVKPNYVYQNFSTETHYGPVPF